MKQREVEALMAALWGIVDRPVRRDGAPSAKEELRHLMAQADPKGLYRPAPQAVAIPAAQAGVHT
jgi:hypothetical protein